MHAWLTSVERAGFPGCELRPRVPTVHSSTDSFCQWEHKVLHNACLLSFPRSPPSFLLASTRPTHIAASSRPFDRRRRCGPEASLDRSTFVLGLARTNTIGKVHNVLMRPKKLVRT